MITSTKNGDRLSLVFNLREVEKKTFKEIGIAIGCGSQRANQLYGQAKWQREEWSKLWWFGLSVRAANCLGSVGVSSRDEARAAFRNNTLIPLKRPRNYGWLTHKEIASWLGLPEPMKPAPRVCVPKTCPHCGGKL